jgi:hypothetical protein
MASGTTTSPFFEANVGAGGGAGFSRNFDPNNGLSGGGGSVKGFPGTGYGAMVGGGVSTVTTGVSPTVGQIWNNLGNFVQQQFPNTLCP